MAIKDRYLKGCEIGWDYGTKGIKIGTIAGGVLGILALAKGVTSGLMGALSGVLVGALACAVFGMLIGMSIGNVKGFLSAK